MSHDHQARMDHLVQDLFVFPPSAGQCVLCLWLADVRLINLPMLNTHPMRPKRTDHAIGVSLTCDPTAPKGGPTTEEHPPSPGGSRDGRCSHECSRDQSSKEARGRRYLKSSHMRTRVPISAPHRAAVSPIGQTSGVLGPLVRRVFEAHAQSEQVQLLAPTSE